MPTVDYLPIAVAAGANVDSQANFNGAGYQAVGFEAGLAQSAQLNKCWRQSSMMAAAIANVISERLNVSVLDDGNLPNLISLFQQANSRGVIDNNLYSVSLSGNLGSFVFPAGVLNGNGRGFRATFYGLIANSGVNGAVKAWNVSWNGTGSGGFTFTTIGGSAAQTYYRIEIAGNFASSDLLLWGSSVISDTTTGSFSENVFSSTISSPGLASAATMQITASIGGGPGNAIQQSLMIMELIAP